MEIIPGPTSLIGVYFYVNMVVLRPKHKLFLSRSLIRSQCFDSPLVGWVLLLGNLFPNSCTLLLLIVYVLSLYINSNLEHLITRQSEMHEIKRKYLNTYVSPGIPTFILPTVVSGFLDPKNRKHSEFLSSALIPAVPYYLLGRKKALDAFY